MTEAEKSKRARECAKKAQQMSPSVQYAIVTVLRNISNGAFWGFTNMRDIKQHMEVLKTESNIRARKLSNNDCLIEVNPSFMIQALQSIDPDAMTMKDMNSIQEDMAKGEMNFEKFIVNKGIRSGVKGQLYSGTIGIYCLNDETSISCKGVVFPAFRVNVDTALKVLSCYGYEIQVGSQFMQPAQASNSGQRLWDSMRLSPTRSGIFIDVRCTITPEEMKSRRDNIFNKKYGIS